MATSQMAAQAARDGQKYMTEPVLDFQRIENLLPERNVTQEEIDTFWRDGVVNLRQILPEGAADYLRDCFEDIFRNSDEKRGGKARGSSDLTKQAEEVAEKGQADRLLTEGGKLEDAKGRFLTEGNCFRWHTDFNRFCTSSPLPQVVAQLLQTGRLKFHNDQVFYKEKGSLLRTAFHQDSSFFSFKGEQVAICWVTADQVTRDSGAMGYIRGSHRWKEVNGKPLREKGEAPLIFQPKNLVTDQNSQPLKDFMPPDMPPLPDIEGNEKDYDIIYMDAMPGDVVIHHVNTVHGSAGNSSLERHRRAASIRYIGDDVVYQANATDRYRPDLGSLSTRAYSSPTKDSLAAKKVFEDSAAGGGNPVPRMEDGDPLEGPVYPMVWPRVEILPGASRL